MRLFVTGEAAVRRSRSFSILWCCFFVFMLSVCTIDMLSGSELFGLRALFALPANYETLSSLGLMLLFGVFGLVASTFWLRVFHSKPQG